MKKHSKTIYKKTLIKVYSYIATHKRGECKIIARDLRMDKGSVQTALKILTRIGYITKRSYADIGVSYYYPSTKKIFCILIFSPAVSHLIFCNLSLEISEHFRYIYTDTIMPDENLHLFLKNAYKIISDYSTQKPQDSVYLFCPRKTATGKIKQDELYFPELGLVDLKRFVKERMNASKASIIYYDYENEVYDFTENDIVALISKILTLKLVKTKNKKHSNEKK